MRSWLALLALGAVGCASNVGGEDIADAASAQTQGLVIVERVVSADGAQSNVSAKFMRLNGSADAQTVDRLVGARLEVPPQGSCRVVQAGRDERVTSLAGVGSIELLDVGDVTVRAGGVEGPLELPLATRAFPDVGERVSGVFYTSRDAATDLPAAARYTLEASGSASVDKFAIDADAPPALEDVKIGELALADTGLAIDLHGEVRVGWKMSSSRVDASDAVVVDVSGNDGASVRCAFDDAGEGAIPAATIRTLGDPAQVAVTVHRVRQQAFAAPGVDVGELRFDLAIVGRASTIAPLSRSSAP